VPARVWIAGEGNSELGVGHDDDRSPGVIEALLRRACATGWECERRVAWRSIRKFKAGGARSSHADTRNILGFVLEAKEHGADAAVFVRDRDKDVERDDAVKAALDYMKDWEIQVVGGLARPNTEGWILALDGVAGTDDMSPRRVDEVIETRGLGGKQAHRYVAVIEAADSKVPVPPSLKAWLDEARTALLRLTIGA
jgi:hypothetical protein